MFQTNLFSTHLFESTRQEMHKNANFFRTLSVQKLGMVLAQKISEFLIFRKGPVMEVLKIPNFLERLGQKFKFLMKISIFTYRF